MGKEKNIYEKYSLSEEEKERLEKLEYPSRVSQELIGEEIEGKALLDIGSGPNTDLKEFSEKHKARYVAFDISNEFLRKQAQEGASAVLGSADNLPFKDGAFDITHERFVLMHLSPNRRENVIKEAYRAAREKSFFLEYDWGTFEGSEAVNKFRDFTINLMKKMGIEPMMGEILNLEIKKCLGEDGLRIEKKRISRQRDNYYDELLPLTLTIQEALKHIRDDELLNQLKSIRKNIEDESRANNPEGFIPPDIVSVEIKKTQ